MDPVYLFGLASQQRSWLSARQSLVAQNVANANTPGFHALDLMPFSKTLDEFSLGINGSDPRNFPSAVESNGSIALARDATWETTHSGNSVSLEAEMIKSGEIRGDFALNSNVLKVFQGMWLNSLKG